jgi:hypothetical protein
MEQEEFKDTKEVIRSGISKKDKQHNDHTKKDKRTNNDLENIPQKIRDRATRTQPRVNSCAPEGLAVPALHAAPVVLLLRIDIYIIFHRNISFDITHMTLPLM